MPPRVLLVDADPDALARLEAALAQEFELRAVASADAALELLRREPFDVIVADQRLHGTTGVDLLEQAARLAPATVRVLASGAADVDCLADAIGRAQVSHFVSKPLDARAVRQVLRAAAPPRHRATPRVAVVAATADVRAQRLCALPAGHEACEAIADDGTLARLCDADVDTVLLDLDVGTEQATRLVSGLLRLPRPVPVVVVADDGGLDAALALVRLGAHDLVLRPFRADELALRLLRAQERRRMASQVLELERSVRERYSYRELVGGSEAMREVYALCERVAATDTTVMLRGETGTGKELVARVLHQASARSRGPFVAVSCAAMPEALLESELFGHERGAFTGATERQLGRFEMASGGTLFIDEVGDMPLAAQVKILRVLQERELERVGGRQPIKVDVRIIAATHVDLEAAVAAGRFRQDLYYRLQVLEVRIPPLRERPGDAALLAGHFLEQLSARMRKRGLRLTREALALIEAHPWPGNVRELGNVIERAVAVTPSHGTIGAELLALRPAAAASAAPAARADVPSGAGGIREAVEQLERTLVQRALESHAGNITRAAAQLGITRQALSQKMTRLGVRGDAD
jgi:DNA-binding NtrC family response regulator